MEPIMRAMAARFQKIMQRFLFHTSDFILQISYFRLHTFLLLAGCLTIFLCVHQPTAGPISPVGSADDWPAYGHDAGGMRYSPLTQINKGNVGTLKLAWTFHTGDISNGKD